MQGLPLLTCTFAHAFPSRQGDHETDLEMSLPPPPLVRDDGGGGVHRGRGRDRPRGPVPSDASGPAGRGDRHASGQRRARSQPPANVTGAVPAGSRLTIQFWLTPRTAAAERLRHARCPPRAAGMFGHYLVPGRPMRPGSARPPRRPRRSMSWLRSAGFTGVGDRPVPRLRAGDRAGLGDRSGAAGAALDYYRAPGAAAARASTRCAPMTGRSRCPRRSPATCSGSPASTTPRR